CNRLPRSQRDIGDMLPSIRFRPCCVQPGHWNHSGLLSRDCNAHTRDESGRHPGVVILTPSLHLLSQLIESQAEAWQSVQGFVLTESLVIGIADEGMHLSVIVVQVGLLEPLWVVGPRKYVIWK